LELALPPHPPPLRPRRRHPLHHSRLLVSSERELPLRLVLRSHCSEEEPLLPHPAVTFSVVEIKTNRPRQPLPLLRRAPPSRHCLELGQLRRAANSRLLPCLATMRLLPLAHLLRSLHSASAVRLLPPQVLLPSPP
jgi:hypothetical protein